MRRLHVLQVGKFYPPHRGGMETHLELLCEGLSRSCNVDVVVASNNRRTRSEWANGVRVTRAGTIGHMAGTAISPGVARIIRESQADVVHLHWPNPAAVAAYLASRHDGELVITYHSDVVRQKILGKAFSPLLNTVLNRASAIIVTSGRYLETSSILQRVSRKCQVIPLG